MKKKILLIAIAVAASVTIAIASDATPSGGERGTLNTSQQVIVTSYSYHSGYEYASRIMRFHTSYATFDFYSPVYTETYWYRYTPYSWGVSIYDDWHYYGAGASGHAWRSRFGGSYWWGYDTWRNYDPWMGYGWNSWNNPGVSYSVNYYLGRPHYHYPVAYNNWNNHYYRNYNRPVTVINNNTYNYYYGSEKRNSYQGSSSGYNPTNPNTSGRRTGYTSTGGRSSGSGTSASPTTGGRTETGTQTGTQGRTQTGTQGRTQTGTRTGTRSTRTRSQSNPQTSTQPNKVQGTVRTTSQRRETVMRQGTPSGTTTPRETTARQGAEKSTEKASEATTTVKETKKTATPAKRRR